MYHIRNTECTCGTHPGNSVTCPVVDSSQLRSNRHQQIHTGYIQDAEHMRTGQTAQELDKYHTNIRAKIFILRRQFEVLNMSKTCQQIGPDKADITCYGTHSSHEG